jgi:pantetheine-phosphate adenylyltransferase
MSGRAVYPGTFDPFTAGHRDVVDRVRRLFDEVVVLVAVNGDKRPAAGTADRADRIRAALGASVLVRGVRDQADLRHEYPLAVMNESLGVTTLLVPARPELARVSSTAVRRSADS